jgi:glycerol-3-phosphate dehydrogenase (NAD(P)+)
MPERVTILGNGAMATVCSILLTSNGHAVTMWGANADSIERLVQDREQSRLLPGVRVPDAVRLTAEDRACFDGASLILSAIPTQYMRAVWERLQPHVPAGISVVSVAKGIENSSLLTPSQVIRNVMYGPGPGGTVRMNVAALSGPNIAGEIAKYKPATAVVAAEDAALARRVQSAFSTQWFRVYTNTDVPGVELAGAMKNVIAIAAGIVDGLGLGNNAKAALVTRGLVEITRLGVAMGAREATFGGLGGLGDLITTCVSPEGRNRHVGEQIGKGRSIDQVLGEMRSVAEGVATTRSVMELAVRFEVEMPITAAVHAVLFEGKDVLAALTELMTREPKAEGD